MTQYTQKLLAKNIYAETASFFLSKKLSFTADLCTDTMCSDCPLDDSGMCGNIFDENPDDILRDFRIITSKTHPELFI